MRKDALYSVGSFAFVLVYAWWHCRSGFIAVGAMLLVSLSVPLALVLYRLVGMTRFAVINVLAAYLIVAMGADAVFILYDLWRKTAQDVPHVRGRAAPCRAGEHSKKEHTTKDCNLSFF